MTTASQNRKLLAKTAARRRKVRAAALLRELPTASPHRAKAREQAREKFEVGISKSPSKAKIWPKKKSTPQPRAERGVEVKGAPPVKVVKSRKNPNAAALKRERLERGETRAQSDARRWGASKKRA